MWSIHTGLVQNQELDVRFFAPAALSLFLFLCTFSLLICIHILVLFLYLRSLLLTGEFTFHILSLAPLSLDIFCPWVRKKKAVNI